MANRWVAVYPQTTRLVFTARTPREAGKMLAEAMGMAAERYNAHLTDWRWRGNGYEITWSDGLKELFYVGWESESGITKELSHSERSDFDADFFKVLRA